MSKYCKKSDVVDAVQFDHSLPWPEGVISWKRMPYQPRDMSWGCIETPEGRMHVQSDDWILTNMTTGERYLRTPDAFKQDYYPVVEETAL